MDMGLLAGGVSRGLDQALQGANQGLLQGEQIRHLRAGEGLQQEHLGLQRDQLTNQLAQQAFTQGMARADQALRQQHMAQQLEQIRNQNAYHEAQLKMHGGKLDLEREEFGLKQQRAPLEQDLLKAHAQYYRDPKLRRAGGSGTFEERWKNAEAAKRGYDTYFEMPPTEKAELDKAFTVSRPYGPERLEGYGDRRQHTALLDQQLRILIANPHLNAEEQMTAKLAEMKMRRIGSALSRVQDARINGVPPDPQDVLATQTSMDEVLQDVVRLQNRIAARGANQIQPSSVPPPEPTQPRGAQTEYERLRMKWLGGPGGGRR